MGSKAIIMKDSEGNNVYPCSYYPVGSIYMSVNNINPSNFFGGTWEQIKDRFLLACGDTYKNGAIGGSATHTLSVDEMPTHNHNLVLNGGSGSSNWGASLSKTGNGWDENAISSAGGNNAHNNMPPYLVVYIWKRVS